MQEDSRHDLIRNYNKEIIKIYQEENLNNLAGLQGNFELNGRDILSWYFDTIRKGQIKFNDFDFNKLFDDLLFCSDEIIYTVAHLFLYRPYINNPLTTGSFFYGNEVFANYQNLEGKRYDMYLDIVSQQFYNYWDRIGDLLAVYFPNIFLKKKIYFSTTIESIPSLFHGSENYKWLKEFADNQYKALNRIRKDIVHYVTSSTNFKWTHLQHAHDRSEMENWFNNRIGLADFYKKHNVYTLEGFEKTILLIEEITALKRYS
ncbi:Cthe_2314 family HEPN domain-containing protein [Rhodocytophaga aerolata]|uniref:Cthe_2314 family HEPN domain-containing protein n=1 Tax=Rhodocytophaga aerolata TaxID=455078 RepID=A0ABT8RA22_9BACT|nr:Cthe_2314 family HEPN domain-containing protein [Rhodocytophaga aerolata]MDO1448927.1 Cthe_2314 family HEPN domain-containing protein [Rhodocytophaga aerolata]